MRGLHHPTFTMRVVVALAMLPLLLACGQLAPLSVDGGAETSEDRAVGPLLMVRVVDWELETPLQGAAVALDAPDGTRSEALTNMQGVAVFRDVEWTGEQTASVVAYAPGYFVVARVGLIEADADGPVTLSLSRRSYDDITVPLVGATLNLESEEHFLSASVDQRVHDDYEGLGPRFGVRVSPDEAFTLSAYEWSQRVDDLGIYNTIYRWWRFDSVGIDALTYLELTEDDSVITEKVKGTVSFPEAGHPMQVDGLLLATVTAGEGDLVVGMSTASMREPHHRHINVEIEQWAAFGAEDLETLFLLLNAEELSMVSVPGRLVPDDFLLDFPVPARITTPEPGDEQSLYAPIEFTNPHPERRVFLIVGGWGRVDAPEGTTRITVPRPPSTAKDDRRVFPPSDVREAPAEVYLCQTRVEHGACVSLSVSRMATVLR